MKLERLVKQLKREVSRNPKKSAILGMLFVVALYFWAPLIRDWLPGEKRVASNDPVVKEPAAKAVTPVDLVNNTKANQLATDSWVKLVKFIDEDRRMMTAFAFEDARDPFNTTAANPTPAETKPSPEATNTRAERDKLHLDLTIVGAGRRIARINGHNYAEKSVLTINIPRDEAVSEVGVSPNRTPESDGQKSSANSAQVVSAASDSVLTELVVESIMPGHVILIGGGETYELKIDNPNRHVDKSKIIMRRISEVN